MSSSGGSAADAEDIFDAIADSASTAPPLIENLSEEDRIADERFVVGAFEAAASNHTWQSDRGGDTDYDTISKQSRVRRSLIFWQQVQDSFRSIFLAFE